MYIHKSTDACDKGAGCIPSDKSDKGQRAAGVIRVTRGIVNCIQYMYIYIYGYLYISLYVLRYEYIYTHAYVHIYIYIQYNMLFSD